MPTTKTAPSTATVAGVPNSGGLQLLNVPLEAIEPDERNPRGEIAPQSIEGLAGSMRELGLLQPVRVGRAPDGRLLLRAGHRRLAAARLLGWPTISAVVYETDEDDAIEAMLVENGQREGLDPIGEARIVGELLSLPGMTRERAAARLGRSVSWVAKRARLTNLSPAARKAMQAGGALEGKPVSWLEEIALLPPHVQNALLGAEPEGPKKQGGAAAPEEEPCVPPSFEQFGSWKGKAEWEGPNTLEDLRAHIRQACLPLRLAGWELDDAELVPAVGACTTCPRQTSADPDLFGSIDGAATDALCTDRRCWAAKQTAALAPKLREARAKHGKDLLLLEGSGGPRERGPEPKLGAEVEESGKWKRGRKNAQGARPAFYTSGAKVGTTEWVVPAFSGRGGSVGAGGKKGGPIPLEERRRRLERKRNAHVAKKLLELVEGTDTSESVFPTAEVAIQVLGAWGARGIEPWMFANYESRREDKDTSRLVLLEGPCRDALERLWEGCADEISAALGRVEKPPVSGQDPAPNVLELQAAAQVLGVDYDELRAAAVEACPEPKSWAAQEEKPAKGGADEGGTPKQRQRARRKAAAKAGSEA